MLISEVKLYIISHLPRRSFHLSIACQRSWWSPIDKTVKSYHTCKSAHIHVSLMFVCLVCTSTHTPDSLRLVLVDQASWLPLMRHNVWKLAHLPWYCTSRAVKRIRRSDLSISAQDTTGTEQACYVIHVCGKNLLSECTCGIPRAAARAE